MRCSDCGEWFDEYNDTQPCCPACGTFPGESNSKNTYANHENELLLIEGLGFLFEEGGLIHEKSNDQIRGYLRLAKTLGNENLVRAFERVLSERSESAISSAYMPWSSQDDQSLKNLFGKNLSIRAIAKKFNRSEGAIRSRLDKLGLSSPPPSFRPSSTLYQIKKAHKNAYNRWSYEEERTLVDSLNKGQSVASIAKTLGRQPSAIASRMIKMINRGDLDAKWRTIAEASSQGPDGY